MSLEDICFVLFILIIIFLFNFKYEKFELNDKDVCYVTRYDNFSLEVKKVEDKNCVSRKIK